MKQAFIETITGLMRKDKNLITVTADMGFSVYEDLQVEFPDRFINTGVTEQASIGFATGLALSGHTVFFYAQAAFATMRCFEQVRLDLGYNFANVKIVGVNAGFGLNQLGVSHFAQEDVGLMRLIPKMTIFSPATSREMKWAVNRAYSVPGPAYIRYSKLDATERTAGIGGPLRIGEPRSIISGSDAVLFASGGILDYAYQVVLKLQKKGVNLHLYSFPTIKPISTKSVREILSKTKQAFVLEEHNVIGGLGSAISEIVAENDLPVAVTRLGVHDVFTGVTGSIPFLLDRNHLSPQRIFSAILKKLSSKKYAR